MDSKADARAISRRRFLRLTFLAGLGAAAAGGVAGLVAFAYPRSPDRFSALATIDAAHVPAAGAAPIVLRDFGFWLANLSPGEGREYHDTRPAPGGLLALSSKCPREGCTVPWRPNFVWSDRPDGRPSTGWFRCPCCGATFTKAGVRVFGPAPRSMDRYTVTVLSSGDVVVDTSRRMPGTLDDPHDTMPYPRGNPHVVRAPARRDTASA